MYIAKGDFNLYVHVISKLFYDLCERKFSSCLVCVILEDLWHHLWSFLKVERAQVLKDSKYSILLMVMESTHNPLVGLCYIGFVPPATKLFESRESSSIL